MSNSTTLAKRLGINLEQEYNALVNGDIGQLEALAEIKLELLEKISETGVDGIPEPEILRRNLVRNQILTLSALEGMKSAIDRAHEVTDVAQRLRTYGANGKRMRFDAGTQGNLSKKS